MGANGDVTSFFVPGGVQLAFTGQAVLHPDGAQLQRVGLIPDVRVSPTLRGVRAGDDELLAAGVREALRSSGADAALTRTALVAERASERADALAQRAQPKPAQVAMPASGAALADAFAAHGDGFDGGHDAAVHHADARTIVLRAKPSGPAAEFGTYMESLPADTYRGQRVRISGYLRSADAGFASFWLRVDGPGGMQAFDNMANRALTGTHDWTPFAIVLDVPADARTLNTGLLLQGKGAVWADDLRIDVVDRTVATTGTP